MQLKGTRFKAAGVSYSDNRVTSSDRTNCAATLTSVFGRDRASRSRLKKALVRIRIYDTLVVIEDGSHTRKNGENLCTATTECYSED